VIWQDLREPRFRGLSRKENAQTETQPYLAGLVTDHDRMTNPTEQEEPTSGSHLLGIEAAE
jgi:hypothetical protein